MSEASAFDSVTVVTEIRRKSGALASSASSIVDALEALSTAIGGSRGEWLCGQSVTGSWVATAAVMSVLEVDEDGECETRSRLLCVLATGEHSTRFEAEAALMLLLLRVGT